jgi:hypothetical protein
MAKKGNDAGAWGKVLGVIKGIAPTVATALGGPVGGIAVNAIMGALGVESEDEAIAALSSDPQAVLKLKLAEVDFKKFLREADLKDHQLVIQDRGDARSMAKTLGKIWPQFTIVTMLTAMIAAVIYGLFFMTPPEGSKDVLYMVLGQLTTAWAASIAFFVGTTKSSAEKSEQIATLRA